MRRLGLGVAVGCLFAASLASAQESAPAPPPPPPPPPLEEEPIAAKHAPKYSLWVGPRVGFAAFGLNFFENEPRRDSPSAPETTGNFVGNGVATEIDVGVRLGHRYIPYFFYEHGFMGQGHRFTGSSATSSTEFYGIGCRFGGADDFGFIADLSIGERIVRVSNGGQTYTMSGLEVFKLALGAEYRVSTLFTVEATASVAGGSMHDSSGDVMYSTKGSKDGRTHPDYQDGSIGRNSDSYIVFGVGAGIHFDLFGK